MQYADLMRPGEDWRRLEDASERWKIQNRIAQRAYRRNMRERGNEIEQLKKQLRTYEELHTSKAPDKEGTYKRADDGWCPPQQAQSPCSVACSEERYHVAHCVQQQRQQQQQVCPTTLEQRYMTNSPKSVTRQQRVRPLVPPTNQRTVTEPPTPSSSRLPIEDGMNSDGMMPLGSTDLSAMTDDDFAFDMAEFANMGQRSTSLLHMAVAGNHIDTVNVLLQDERISIDDIDSDGFTPLQRAVMHGRSEIVKLLLEHSANIGTMDGFGSSFSR